MNNRILIASPMYGDVSSIVLEDWIGLIYYCGRVMQDYEFFLGIKPKSEQFRARNMIVEAAQQFNCDRILMLDDDMVIDWEKRGRPAYEEFLPKLLSHDKDICGVLYYQRGQECQPVLMTKINEKGYRFLRDDEIKHGLQKVDVAGGGCLLIKTKVFDRIPYPYFAAEYEFGTDIQLCRKAAEKGFEIWADTSIELGHLRNEKAVVTSQNKHQFQDGTPIAMKRTFVMSDLFQRITRDAMEYTDILSTEEMFYRGRQPREEVENVSDAESYRMFPIDRICRQVWFNTQNDIKKKVTEFILAGIPNNRPLRILEFGSGIGLLSFALAEKGHDVTALDIRGTETLEFLKWRAAKYGIPMKFIESEGGPPTLKEEYDIIIAVDSIEHVEQWRETVRILSDHVRPQGMFFANNGIFEDMSHPEHYDVTAVDFVKTCADARLMPHTQISYIKQEVKTKDHEPQLLEVTT